MGEQLGAICGACGEQVPLDGASCRYCGHSFIGDLVGAGAGRAKASGGRRLPEAVTRRHKAVLSGLVVDEDVEAELDEAFETHVAQAADAALDLDEDGPPTVLAAPPVRRGPRPEPRPEPPVELRHAPERQLEPEQEPELEDDAGERPRRRTGLVLLVLAALLVVALVACVLAFLRPGAPAQPTGSVAGSGGSGSTGRSWTSTATAQAPATSPDSRDAAGHATSYAASQVLDGDLTTAWRRDGDGAGTTLTIALGADRRITTLGLVNGYAKVDPASGTDRYTQERRITKVTWIVGGHEYPQTLTDGTRTVQVLPVGPVTASTVELRIDATTAPGDAHFDKTAISEVRVAG